MPDSPKRRLPSIPLLARVIIALAAVGIVPFLVSVYQIVSGRDAVVAQVQQTHLVSVVATADRVQGYLELLGSLGRSTLENPVLRSAPGSEDALALLTGILEARASLIAAGLFIDPADAESGRRPVAELVQLARRSAGRQAVDAVIGDLDARPVAMVSAAGERWLRLRLPVPDTQLFLLLVADLEPIKSALRPQEVGKAAEMVLWSPGEGSVIGRFTDGDEVPEDLLKLAGHAASAADTYALEGGVEVVAAFAVVPNSPWLVLSRQPMQIAAQAALVQRRVAVRAFGLVLLICGGIVFLTHRTIVSPIRAMLAEQQRIGGFDAATGGGEISQLRHAFERLTRSLHDREAMNDVFLGRYRVVEIVGAGAMGTVFRAWDPRLERPVALKTVKIDLGVGEGASDLAAQLVREAVTLARLNHPNIVTVYDAASDGELAYLAMELVEGISLDRYVRQEKNLPFEQVVAVGVAVARALDAAHKRGVVHQDIKPANILLGTDGSIKVTDFGIAELLGRAQNEDRRAVVCGTPGYLAPEVARGESPSEASDIFALGVVLYQSITGQRPFSGATPKDVMVATVSGTYTSIRTLRPETPRRLVQLVNRLLAKHRDQRPPSARAVADTLAQAVSTGSLPRIEGFDAREGHLPPHVSASLGAVEPTRPASGFTTPDMLAKPLQPTRKSDDSTVDTQVLSPPDSAASTSD